MQVERTVQNDKTLVNIFYRDYTLQFIFDFNEDEFLRKVPSFSSGSLLDRVVMRKRIDNEVEETYEVGALKMDLLKNTYHISYTAAQDKYKRVFSLHVYPYNRKEHVIFTLCTKHLTVTHDSMYIKIVEPYFYEFCNNIEKIANS